MIRQNDFFYVKGNKFNDRDIDREKAVQKSSALGEAKWTTEIFDYALRLRLMFAFGLPNGLLIKKKFGSINQIV